MEATMSLPCQPRKSNIFPLLVLFVVVVCGLYGVKVAGSHAVEKHGEVAIEIRNCLDNNGAFQVWSNTDTHRYAEVCNLGDPEKWGLRIVEKIKGEFRELTAFIEEQDISGVEEYLLRRGYGIIEQASGIP